MKKRITTELLIFIVLTELIGILSAIITGDSFSRYNELIKPPFSPPSILFPIVWAILYALMGISAYLIYDADAYEFQKKKALFLYGLQLFFNFLWSIVFFRFKMMGASVAVILILFLLIFAMIILFRRIRPISAYLNYPYLLWTAFAIYLNIGTLVLN